MIEFICKLLPGAHITFYLQTKDEKKKRFNVTEEQNHDEFKWFWFSSHLPSEILLVYTSPVHIYLCIPVYTTSTV